MLEIVYKNVTANYMPTLFCEAHTFSLAFLGDLSTIHCSPFINRLAMCADIPPVVIVTNDCTPHLVSSGKKDVPYVTGMFSEQVQVYRLDNLFTDCFFFDGTKNVQKVGKILTAKYPQYLSHVLSLFFLDGGGNDEIQICTCFYYFFIMKTTY